MLRPATPLTILLLGAFGLLVLSVISTPIIRIIPLASFAGIDFGVFGFCKADQCSPIELGYDTSNLFDDAQSSTFNLPSSTRATLSIILIVHPIAAFLTFTMLILAASAHFHSPSHSPRYLLGIFILSILTLLASLLSFLIDVLLFVPHMQWGSYLVLAATVLITVSGIISCAMRRTLVSRKARKKRIAENAEMNGENFYNRQGPRTSMLPVATGPLASGALGEEKPKFATFDSTKRVNNLETVSDERIPLTRRTTVQSSSSIPAPIGNSNILPQRDDSPFTNQTNNILPRTSHSQSESNNLRPYEQPIIRQFSENGGVPGSFGGTQGALRGGFQGRGRGAFDPGRGDFRSGRGGFVPGRGGFAPGRGGFAPGRGGFAPGRGGFASGRGGFVSERGDYMPARGGYGLDRSDYQASRGNYHGPSGEILDTERMQGRNLGPSQVGTHQSKPYYDMSQLPSAQPAYDIYSPVSPTEYSAYNPNTSDESLPRAESPPLTDFESFIDEPNINPNPGAPQQPSKKSEVARNLRPNGVDFPGTPYTISQDALQESIVSRENSITNADMSYSSPRSDWEINGQPKISNSPAKSTTTTLKSNTSEYRQIHLEENYFQAANPNQINQPLTPAPLAPRPTKPIVGIETKFGLNIDSYYDEFGFGARSPADSDISNFTSVSQRGINPRWNDEVHNGLRQVTPQRDPAQQK